MQAQEQKADSKIGLGTFGGVFTPSILTILGVIMYLRFGWVVGNVGLLGALLIVTLANAITLLTSLSVCAIATDRVVRVGGAYYMISRSLGIETGGAVGIPLYFAQALSVALYTLGFTESLVATFPQLNSLYVALGVTSLVGVLALTSANIAIRVQYLIMAAIALSLLSFFLGQPVDSAINIDLWVSNKAPFWNVFAVFFPAVTGIMAGVNMSGDLRDPSRALPIGTLAAVGTGYLIYMILPIFLAFRAENSSLIADPLIMKRIASWGPAILLGVWGATLSSAIGSILGAPRVLQALARDGVLPQWMRFLAQGSGPTDEPKNATLVTLTVAIAAVCIGDLNLIAPVLTMFFLTTYFVLNMSAGIEGFVKSPSFRPSFQVSWFFSLLGAIGCVVVMILINLVATMVATIVVVGVYFWVRQRELRVTWGDVRRGIWLTLFRTALLQIDHKQDTKNWRPQMLVFAGAPTRRWPLIQLADSLTHNRGLVTIASVLPLGTRDNVGKATLESHIRNYLERRGVEALVRLVTATDPFEGIEKLVESYGLGSVVPNTILLGDSENADRQARFCQTICYLHQARRNVIILRYNPSIEQRQNHRRIDIWWGGGIQGNGSLMLILAYLLQADPRWLRAEICLKLVVSDEPAAQAAENNLKKLAQRLRVDVTCEILRSKGRDFSAILHQASSDADLVLLGMATPGEDFESTYTKLHQWAQTLPTTIFVLARPGFDFGEVLGKE